MSNELDLYSNGGQVVPISPGTDLYQPTAEDAWDETPDYLDVRSAPFADQQAEQNFRNIANAFTNDMASLGYVQRDIDLCINWFKNSLSNPPQRMPVKNHSYNLWQYSNDPAMNHFANYAHQQKLSQNMIQSICYWLQQFEDLQNGVGRFASQQVHVPVSSDPTDSLSDADYDRVVAINNQAAANTMGRLKDFWGSSYAANMRVVQNHFASLTTAEQDTLSQYSTGWIKGTNTFEILVSLYAEAVQAHTIPRDGASIERELKTITDYMRNNRAAYLKDEATQARFRELLNLQSGGR